MIGLLVCLLLVCRALFGASWMQGWTTVAKCCLEAKGLLSKSLHCLLVMQCIAAVAHCNQPVVALQHVLLKALAQVT
jgi:hypothetical protein